jgi:hypothetical protein
MKKLLILLQGLFYEIGNFILARTALLLLQPVKGRDFVHSFFNNTPEYPLGIRRLRLWNGNSQ